MYVIDITQRSAFAYIARRTMHFQCMLRFIFFCISKKLRLQLPVYICIVT